VDGHASIVRSNEFRTTSAEDQDSKVEWNPAKSRSVYWYPYYGAPQ
jgi:hypothetical protein